MLKKPSAYNSFYELNLEKIFFIDIETVGAARDFAALPKSTQALWEKKATSLRRYKYNNAPTLTPQQIYLAEAGIHSEFAKIVCISVGFLRLMPEKRYKFHVTSYISTDETEILKNFFALFKNNPDYYLCAHNGFNFDFPFIARRSIIQNIALPAQLKILLKKPWEVYWLLDTMNLWGMIGNKNFTSLETLAHVLDFPSPKQSPASPPAANPPAQQSLEATPVATIDGSHIQQLYYQNAHRAIQDYCQRDTLAVAQIVLRLRELPIVQPDDVVVKQQQMM